MSLLLVRYRLRAFPRYSLTCALALLVAVLGLGCGSSSRSGELSGKVTLNGEGVAGTIVLLGSDGKEAAQGPILAGRYLIMNPPKGEYDVVVRPPVTGAPTGVPAPKPEKDKEKGGGTLAGTSQGAAPPEKYSRPGALEKLKVTGSKQEHNITLTP